MNQLSLFPTAPDSEATAAPAQRHSATSVAAAEAIEPKVGLLRYRVHTALCQYPDGLTDEELADITFMRQETARARRIGLMHDGIVKDSGKTRPTSTGRAAKVWTLTRKE